VILIGCLFNLSFAMSTAMKKRKIAVLGSRSVGTHLYSLGILCAHFISYGHTVGTSVFCYRCSRNLKAEAWGFPIG